MTKEEAIKLYGFNTANVLLRGADLLKYIGQEVVLVEYIKRQEDNSWTSIFRPVVLDWVGDFDNTTYTYKVKYTDGVEKKEETIIPEGISFDIVGCGIQDHMVKFIPESLHLKCMEDFTFYKRLEELWDKNETILLDEIFKGDHKFFSYLRHIAVVGKTDEGQILYFRLGRIKIRPVKGNLLELTLEDENKNVHIITCKKDDLVYEWKGIGQMKIMSL